MKSKSHSVPQAQVQQQQQIRTIFDPQVVKEYSNMVQDAPHRILKMMEDNNKTEREIKELPFRETARRDWMGFVSIISVLAASVLFAYLDKLWFSGGTLVIFVSLLISAFIHKKPVKV